MSNEVARIAGHVIPTELQLDVAKTAATCEGFLRDYFKASGHATGIIGLSGGIDSALVAHLLVNALGRDRVRGVFMPSDTSAPSSLEDARLVARQLEIETEEISIALPLQAVVAGLPDGQAIARVRRGNIAARLRMITL